MVNEKAARDPSGDSLQIATARDGTQLVYQLNSSTGPARYVLVHSLAMEHSFWDPVVEYLQDSGQVITLDCRGHGKSSKPPGPYTARLFADDVADVMADAGWKSAVVAGASMGGCVSLAFAQAYPGMLDGLGLIDTTAWYGPNAPKEWEDRAQKAVAQGMAALVGFQKTRWFSDRFREAHPDIVDHAVTQFIANDVKAYVESCRMMGLFDGRKTLAQIRVPTVILVGEEDYATPVAMAEALHQGIRGATLHVIKGVRHLTPCECPEIVAEKLRGVADNRSK